MASCNCLKLLSKHKRKSSFFLRALGYCLSPLSKGRSKPWQQYFTSLRYRLGFRSDMVGKLASICLISMFCGYLTFNCLS